jgi:hypothetical protein
MKELTTEIWERVISAIVSCDTIDMVTFCGAAGVSVSDFLAWEKSNEEFRAAVAYAYSAKMHELEHKKKYYTLRFHQKVIALAEARIEDQEHTETKEFWRKKPIKVDNKTVYEDVLDRRQVTTKKRYASDKLLEQALSTVLPEVFHKEVIKPKQYTPPSLFDVPDNNNEYDLSKLNEQEIKLLYELLEKLKSK